ncbi:fimbrial biogenesis chaperone [Biformimicrobium ophioploci]|uniref:Fimbria/pilus periplasmic chaperone n=1 Tax=Biformimicrobium ophioploci TaxID=3036711 RepID=A0ABQ6LZ16_9GAMM|nr:hypothetical protein [Microbulbifer sp. NKW57]GMG87308.1 fimbria/pilus periplasmic chaperone [Microbulbifer sp. NKW57]
MLTRALKSLVFLCITAAAVLFSSLASASMQLDKMIIYLDALPNQREDIVVRNPDAETLYLQTEVFRVDNPGQEDEKLVPIVDPRDFMLLVNPRKAVIPSGAQKRFRLMSLESGLEQEKVYRVTFKPVVGEITSDVTGVKILVAYQALIFVQPPSGAYELKLEKRGEQWVLRNNGNINVEVSKARWCVSEDSCEDVEFAGRIYGGAEKAIKLPASGGYLELRAYDGEQSRLEKFPR